MIPVPKSLLSSSAARGRREFSAIYALAFLTATAFAPHRHANSLEDLISDGRSDSGIFVEQPTDRAPGSGPCMNAARIIDDEACLACFQHDSITEMAAISSFEPDFETIRLAILSRRLEIPAASISRSRSRAPPPAV